MKYEWAIRESFPGGLFVLLQINNWKRFSNPGNPSKMEERNGNHHMELFKTTGVLDEPILREVAKRGIPKSEKWATIICFTGCLVFSAARYPALAAVFFSVGLFFVLWQYVLFRWITVKRNLRDMQDFNGVLGYQYTTWFDEDGLAVINQTNHGEGKFKYAYLKRIFETEHILALQTIRNQFVPIFKNELSLEELDELTLFLKSRNKKIKICRLKKQNDKGTSGNEKEEVL